MAKQRFAAGEVVTHGAYGAVAAVDMTRHYYAGSDMESEVQGYVEIYEFNPLVDGRPPVVLHSYRTDTGSIVIGFGSVAEALDYERLGFWRANWNHDKYKEAPGFLSLELEPWFYLPR